MIHNVHRIDHGNLGDMMCSPLRYFDLGPWRQVDIDGTEFPTSEPVIIGGGGLIHGDEWPKKLEALIEGTEKTVIWGIGSNVHGETITTTPEWVGRAGIVGIRDYGTKFDYVPCPSCMHQAFDRHRVVSPKRRFLIYEHAGFPIPISGIVRINNNQPEDAFEDVIAFMAQGETVISNSFHGLYWAMLLNRAAVCVMPISSRFYGFKYPPTFSPVESCTSAAGSVHPEYLGECRESNIRFFKKVSDYLRTE